MPSNVNKTIKRIVTDHHTVLFIGVMLMLMGLISFSQNLFQNLLGFEFQISHGFLLLGGFNVLLAVAFMIMGAMNVEAVISKEPDPISLLDERIKKLEEQLKEYRKNEGS